MAVGRGSGARTSSERRLPGSTRRSPSRPMASRRLASWWPALASPSTCSTDEVARPLRGARRRPRPAWPSTSSTPSPLAVLASAPRRPRPRPGVTGRPPTAPPSCSISSAPTLREAAAAHERLYERFTDHVWEVPARAPVAGARRWRAARAPPPAPRSSGPPAAPARSPAASPTSRRRSSRSRAARADSPRSAPCSRTTSATSTAVSSPTSTPRPRPLAAVRDLQQALELLHDDDRIERLLLADAFRSRRAAGAGPLHPHDPGGLGRATSTRPAAAAPSPSTATRSTRWADEVERHLTALATASRARAPRTLRLDAAAGRRRAGPPRARARDQRRADVPASSDADQAAGAHRHEPDHRGGDRRRRRAGVRASASCATWAAPRTAPRRRSSPSRCSWPPPTSRPARRSTTRSPTAASWSRRRSRSRCRSTAVTDPAALEGMMADGVLRAGQTVVEGSFAAPERPRPRRRARPPSPTTSPRAPWRCPSTPPGSSAVSDLISPGDRVNLLVNVPERQRARAARLRRAGGRPRVPGPRGDRHRRGHPSRRERRGGGRQPRREHLHGGRRPEGRRPPAVPHPAVRGAPRPGRPGHRTRPSRTRSARPTPSRPPSPPRRRPKGRREPAPPAHPRGPPGPRRPEAELDDRVEEPRRRPEPLDDILTPEPPPAAARAARRASPPDVHAEVHQRVVRDLVRCCSTTRVHDDELEEHLREIIVGGVRGRRASPPTASSTSSSPTDIRNDVVGYGPIEELLNDDTVTEVMVNGPDIVFVRARGQGRGGRVRLRRRRSTCAG